MCKIRKNSNTIIEAKKYGNAYKIEASRNKQARVVEHGDYGDNWKLWHARLGHTPFGKYKEIIKAVAGIPKFPKTSIDLCGGCCKGKQQVEQFSKQSTGKTNKVLQLVHADVMGPMRTNTKRGSKYVLLFVDDFSRFTIPYFLKSKAEVTQKFM